jgi:hypothetical protein
MIAGMRWLRPVALALLGSAACGPSFQAIYEGNARFEHCYALEERQEKPVTEKAECWHDWSERYTYGQTRDRIQYAIARYVALSQSANVPTDEAMMMAAPGVTPRVSTITAPAPTNAFAPPPKVLEGDAEPPRPLEKPRVVGTPETPPAAPPPTPLPSADCSATCNEGYRGCAGTCVDAGPTKCAACDKTYRACMRGCFK